MKITSINYEASIHYGRLAFKKGYHYYFENLFQISINAALILGVVSIAISWKDYGINEKSFLIVYILFTFYFTFLLFLKLTEDRLQVIKTQNTKEDNKKLVVDYLKQKEIRIQRNSKNILVAFDPSPNTVPFSSKRNYIVILFHEEYIYFTLFTERNKVNFPSLFDKIGLKKELAEITENRNQQFL